MLTVHLGILWSANETCHYSYHLYDALTCPSQPGQAGVLLPQFTHRNERRLKAGLGCVLGAWLPSSRAESWPWLGDPEAFLCKPAPCSSPGERFALLQSWQALELPRAPPLPTHYTQRSGCNNGLRSPGSGGGVPGGRAPELPPRVHPTRPGSLLQNPTYACDFAIPAL